MDEIEQEYHIYRIVSGYTILNYKNETYIVDTPSIAVLNEALYRYRKTIKDNRFGDLLNLEKAANFLIRNKMWTLGGDANLKELEKSMDDAKVALYHSYLENQQLYEKARKHLKLIKEKRIEMLLKKHSIDDQTTEGLASEVRDLYIFSSVLLDGEYNKINIEDGYLLKGIYAAYRKDLPSQLSYRLLSRNNIWKNIWYCESTSCFRVVGEEQRALISYTKMYENAASFSDPPTSEIIEDDDLFDGWMINVQRENEAIKEEKATDRYFRKLSNAGEVFIPVQTDKQAERVINMNDVMGRTIQKKIHNSVDKNGVVNELNIPEIALQHQNRGK